MGEIDLFVYLLVYSIFCFLFWRGKGEGNAFFSFGGLVEVSKTSKQVGYLPPRWVKISLLYSFMIEVHLVWFSTPCISVLGLLVFGPCLLDVFLFYKKEVGR